MTASAVKPAVKEDDPAKLAPSFDVVMSTLQAGEEGCDHSIHQLAELAKTCLASGNAQAAQFFILHALTIAAKKLTSRCVSACDLNWALAQLKTTSSNEFYEEALMRLARTSIKSTHGDLEEFFLLKIVDQGVLAGSDLAWALEEMAKLRQKQGKLNAALYFCSMAIAAHDVSEGTLCSTVGCYVLRASLYTQCKCYDEAEAECRRLMRVAEDKLCVDEFIQALTALGDNLYTQQRYAEAQAQFARALDLLNRKFGERDRRNLLLLEKLAMAHWYQEPEPKENWKALENYRTCLERHHNCFRPFELLPECPENDAFLERLQ
ncbi:MAG: tetratricopeptide repeat protein [Candidatus Obscuribacterales bacterium]|nr:tetratricopeptide repeat protein [Candidatus Obscuribacterales bacterium]